MGDFVRVETDAGIATIRLERPPMNALNGQMQTEIGAAAAQVGADPDVHAVILYGGEKIFAAGADVKEMAEASHARIMEYGAGIENAFKAVARIPKPVIAAVTGYALGGGLELALCADFRVLGEKAKVGQPEILLGIIPGAGGTQRLPRLIGPSRAKDLVFSGRIADAAEALRIGLADRVVPDAEVYEAARKLAAQLRGRGTAGAAGRQAGHRRRPGTGPGRGPGDRAIGLHRAVRHRGPGERDAQFPGERTREGDVQWPVTHAPSAASWTGEFMSEADDGLSLDLVTAALRADSADVAIYARVLTESLSEALPPGTVSVERERSVSDRMRGRPGEVSKIVVRLDNRVMTLSVQRGQPAAEICREVRGVVLSRTPVPLHEWTATLASALVTHAERNAIAAQALRKLVAGS